MQAAVVVRDLLGPIDPLNQRLAMENDRRFELSKPPIPTAAINNYRGQARDAGAAELGFVLKHCQNAFAVLIEQNATIALLTDRIDIRIEPIHR